MLIQIRMHQAISVICTQDVAELTCIIWAISLEKPCPLTLEELCTSPTALLGRCMHTLGRAVYHPLVYGQMSVVPAALHFTACSV